ncbi:MAG: DEAD/DEAH box helicase [Victivallales bacterium]
MKKETTASSQKTKSSNSKKLKKSRSWLTDDNYEIELRKNRMLEETMRLTPVESGNTSIFKDYLVARTDNEEVFEYRVELRSLKENINTCSCPDFRKNFLGTCKHIEKVKHKFIRKTSRRSPYIEIFMSSHPWQPRAVVPENVHGAEFVKKYLTPDGTFKAPAADMLKLMLRNMENLDDEYRGLIRISSEIYDFLRIHEEKQRLYRWRGEYTEKFTESKGKADFLRGALYDYQVAGMLHLAFNGRAMLADEMGLGKTVQAICAAALLKECFGIRRTLVVTPASLKSEWEEQIRKFTSLHTEVVFGSRKQRLETYRNSKAFFLLMNYEQVMRDHEDLNLEFQADLVILDEAQRIKNWKTKTADRLKRLQSRFAFVLTGTPIENRIDELYSLVEFIDPKIFGSLFRFNRRFYRFDEAGKTVGMQNLREMHEEIQPIMLRRRKDEISDQLPERIDNNYFVQMTEEQCRRYEEHEYIAARLAYKAKHYSLSPEEFQRLQRALSCMRMLCDSVYILDQKIRESPKIDELMHILDDLWEDNSERKIIIFSEWVRMLDLVMERLDKRGETYAVHTGLINQVRRRKEINRFKNDPGCKVFLCSESGGVGLNLQVASVVINLDLPWNPAKLEQRIARAWRKHQKNTVNVINLVAEKTIENKMLSTLDFKQGLADAVLDARGDFAEFEKDNAKAAFMERLNQIMGAETSPAAQEASAEPQKNPPVEEILKQELQLNADGIDLCQTRIDNDGRLESIFAVGDDKAKNKLFEKLDKSISTSKIAVITPENMELLRQLEKLGIITINKSDMTEVFRKESTTPVQPSLNEKRLKMSREFLAAAQRHMKMSNVLKAGGFCAEAIPPAQQAINAAALAVYVQVAESLPGEILKPFCTEMFAEVKKHSGLERKHLLLLQLSVHNALDGDSDIVGDAMELIEAVTKYIERQSLS